MTNLITKGLIATTLIATTLMAEVKRPDFFNHLPQDTLFVAHSSNATQDLDFYKDSQLYKELSQIKFKKLIGKLIGTADQKSYDELSKAVFNKENNDLLLGLLDSSFSVAFLKIDIKDADAVEEFTKRILSNTVIQIKPNKVSHGNELIKKLATASKKKYSQTKSNGFVVNQFKINKDLNLYILEKAGTFTITMTLEKTIKLLNKALTDNMNTLKSMAPLYSKPRNSVSYINVKALYKILNDNVGEIPDLKTVAASISFINEYLTWSNTNIDEKSESTTVVTTFNSKIPTYIKTLVKNNNKKSPASEFFQKDTTVFFNYTGLKFAEIVDYFVTQQNIPLQSLLKANPEDSLIYNKLCLALGQDYALNVSGVKPGLIPIPLATVAIEVNSEKIIQAMIKEQLSAPLKSGDLTMMTKNEKGTRITTLASTVPGVTPAYMFYKSYLFVSTDPAELVRILNLNKKDSLKQSPAFTKLTNTQKAQYQTTYINGEKLFETLASRLQGLSPLLAQTPNDKVLLNDLIIPVLKAFKNLKTIGTVSEATSTKEFKTTSKVYIK